MKYIILNSHIFALQRTNEVERLASSRSSLNSKILLHKKKKGRTKEREMGAPVVDDKMDINEETVGVEKEEEAEEIEPSKLLINNVSLIKKSVESKGEPRFIANVFRQVRSISRSRHHHHHHHKNHHRRRRRRRRLFLNDLFFLSSRSTSLTNFFFRNRRTWCERN